MKQHRLCSLFLLILLALFVGACQSQKGKPNPRIKNGKLAMNLEEFIASPNYRHSRDFWRGAAIEQHAPAQTRLLVLREEQRGRLYIKGQVAMDFPLCTGKPGKHETPPGKFRISQKVREHRSTLYGAFVDSQSRIVKGGVRVTDSRPAGSHFKGAKMEYWMRFNGAIGLHEGNVYRERASHGCVRVPPEVAPILYEKMAVGSGIEVR